MYGRSFQFFFENSKKDQDDYDPSCMRGTVVSELLDSGEDLAEVTSTNVKQRALRAKIELMI